jgi:gp16 family phage-associated protein
MPTKKATGLKTCALAREHLNSQGLSIAEFARTHQLPYGIVYQVLTGKKKGRRGAAHKAAVLLGIKRGVVLPDAKPDA